MNKLLSLLAILVVVGMYYFTNIYFPKEFNNENTHTSAANMFWYEQKKLLVEGGKPTLPFTVNINSLDYFIGEPSLEGGTYYFNTVLVINNKTIHIDTAVKPVDGIWTVDTKETFMGANTTTLDHYINSYFREEDYLYAFLEGEYIWGMGDGYSEENEAYLKQLLSTRFEVFQERILTTYRKTAN
jgi:hypothetical protein